MPKTGSIMIHDLCKNQVVAEDSCSVVGLSSEGIAQDFPTTPPFKISPCA